jgi:CelD/BcsL family acetyltransferase involved in cellulose biosynthesis
VRFKKKNSLFLIPEWQEPWVDVDSNADGHSPLSIRLDGTLVGLAIIRKDERAVSFAADTNLCDYLDFLVDPGHEQAVFKAFLNYAGENSWHTIDFQGVQEGSPIVEILPQIVRETGHAVDITEWDVAPYADLPDTWDEYLAKMRKKDRHELRRKKRRLEEAGEFRYRVIQEMGTELETVMEDFFRLMRISREDKAQFLNPEREGFFRNLIFRMASLGYLRLHILEKDQDVISAALGFSYNGTFFLYNSGLDPAYSPLSVGLLIKAYSIEHAIIEGNNKFDFLRTNEPYKYHLGGQDQTVYRCFIELADAI